MDEEIKTNIAAPDTWVRLLLMVLFGICASIALWVVWLVAAAQFLFSLITGRTNANIDSFASVLVAYLGQIFSFLVYQTEERPFPFSPLPDADDDYFEAMSSTKGSKMSSGSRKKPADMDEE